MFFGTLESNSMNQIGLAVEIVVDFSSSAKTTVLVYDWPEQKLSLQIIPNCNDNPFDDFHLSLPKQLIFDAMICFLL